MKLLKIYKWIAGGMPDFTRQFQENEQLYKQAQAFWNKLENSSLLIVLIFLVLGIALAAWYYKPYNNKPGRHYTPKHWAIFLIVTFAVTFLVTLGFEYFAVHPKLQGAFMLEGLKGVGTNETKAYNAAFKTLSKNHAQITVLASKAKEKIITYYESESNNIIKKAKLLADQEKYDEAFYMLSMIPSQCSKFDSAISAGLDMWKKYKNFSCASNIGKARSAWFANQNIDGANLAGIYLAQIFPDAPCYADAMQLYQDIKSRIGELWQYEMKHYDTEAELRMAKIQAWQAIGVAYGKGQQPELVIHKSRY